MFSGKRLKIGGRVIVDRILIVVPVNEVERENRRSYALEDGVGKRAD